LDADDVIG